jgi:hypothetical protein
MNKRIKKGQTIVNQFGQKFKVRRVEFACVVTADGTHIPLAKAHNEFKIVE